MVIVSPIWLSRYNEKRLLNAHTIRFFICMRFAFISMFTYKAHLGVIPYFVKAPLTIVFCPFLDNRLNPFLY